MSVKLVEFDQGFLTLYKNIDDMENKFKSIIKVMREKAPTATYISITGEYSKSIPDTLSFHL